MKLYKLKEPKMKKGTVNVFYGLDSRPDAPDFSLESSNGITSEYFPFISSGKTLKKEKDLTAGAYVFSLGSKMGLISGENLYIDSKSFPLKFSGNTSSVIKMGEKIIAFPDKTYTDEKGNSGSLEASFSTSKSGNSRPYFSLVTADGEDYGKTPVVGTAQPAAAENGDLWIDTSGNISILKIYSNGVFYEITSPLVKISYSGIGASFSRGEGVNISGTPIDGDYVLKEAENDYIIIGAILENSLYSNITIKRSVPDIDFACTHDNRIFGCKKDGSAIYICALGQMKNWNAFEGIASDSYSADVLDGEEFTATKAFGSNVYFFKEDKIYQLRGTKPQNYQLLAKSAPGVKKGCERSVFEYMGVLYYYSPEGFMAFDGSYPDKVFTGFKEKLEKVSACFLGNTIYFSDGNKLYSANPEKGIVTTLSDMGGSSLAVENGVLNLINGTALYRLVGENGSFSAVFNPIGERKTGKEYLSRIDLSFLLKGSISVKLSYDGEAFITVFSFCGKSPTTKEHTAPILRRRHTSLKIMIEGEGEFSLKALSLNYSEV